MSDTSVGLVPEVYYDVIARFCAGAPFVVYLTWRNGLLKDLDAVKLGVILALGSYLLGHILATISAILNAIIWRPAVLKWIVSRMPLDNPFADDSFRAGFHELYKRIDSIGRRDANGGTLLKKMEAGAALSDNLLSGFLLFTAAKFILDGLPSWPKVVAFSGFGVLLVVTVVLRRMVLIGRQDTLWTSLVTGKDAADVAAGKNK